jgi:hypothetical protein
MDADELEWGAGRVTFWDLTFLDAAKPLAEQLDDLKEDLAQARYEGGVLVDVGWSPSFSAEGAFVVRVVREADWDAPLFLERHASVAALGDAVRRAARVAETAGRA